MVCFVMGKKRRNGKGKRKKWREKGKNGRMGSVNILGHVFVRVNKAQGKWLLVYFYTKM